MREKEEIIPALITTILIIRCCFRRCQTDFIRVLINGRLHSTLCGQETLQLVTFGPDVVVEFSLVNFHLTQKTLVYI
jgi:hypothetical protein